VIADENDGRVRLFSEPPLQLEPADIRQMSVEDQAGSRLSAGEVEVRGGLCEGDHLDAEGREACRNLFPELGVFIDEVDHIAERLRAGRVECQRRGTVAIDARGGNKITVAIDSLHGGPPPFERYEENSSDLLLKTVSRSFERCVIPIRASASNHFE
jgi:hypothetical protein